MNIKTLNEEISKLLDEEKDYTYERFDVDGHPFSETIYDDGRHNIKSIHPYDNQEYHWALSKDGETFNIYRFSPGKLVTTVTGTREEIAKKLLELDSKLEQQIDRT